MKRTTDIDLDQLRSLVLIYTGSGATCSHKQIPEQLLDELLLAVREDQRAKDVRVIGDYRLTHALEDTVLHAGLYTAQAVLRKDGPS